MTTKAEREAYLARVDKWRATGVAPAEIGRRVTEMPWKMCFKVVGALTEDEAAVLGQILHSRFARRADRLRQAGRDLAAWLVSLPRRQQPYAERVLTPEERGAARRARPPAGVEAAEGRREDRQGGGEAGGQAACPSTSDVWSGGPAGRSPADPQAPHPATPAG